MRCSQNIIEGGGGTVEEEGRGGWGGISEEEEMGGMWGTQAEVDKNIGRVILLI